MEMCVHVLNKQYTDNSHKRKSKYKKRKDIQKVQNTKAKRVT